MLLGTALTVAGCSPGDASAGSAKKDPIVVGIILPLTGNLAALGNEMYNGYKVAQKTINDGGGIDGHLIEYKVSDAPTPEAAVSVAGRLSTDSKVSLIMGSYSSGIAIPASAVADRNKMVYWETGSVAAETTDRGLKYLFRTNVSTALPAYKAATVDFFEKLAAPALGKDMKDIRIGLAYENGAFGTATADSLKAIAKSRGWQIAVEQPYSANANDLSSVIQNLKRAQVDVLYATSYVNDAILLMKQSKELGFAPKLVFGVGAGFTSPDIAKALGNDVNGIVTSDGAPMNMNDKLFRSDLSPKYSEFTATYKQMIGREPLVMATIGYHGAMVLFQKVLPKADVHDSQSIIKAAKSVDIPQGGTVAFYGVKFDETGQNVRASFYDMQFQDGVLKTIFPLEAASAKLQVPATK